MILSERIQKYVDRCEPAIAGQHGHNRTFAVAAILTWGFGRSVEEAYPFMAAYNLRCQPPWSERDLRRKLAQALHHPTQQKPRGYLLGEAVSYTPSAEPLAKLPPTWPTPNLELIAEIVEGGSTLSDLWEQSPTRFDTNQSQTEAIIDHLFPGDPLLCCAKSNEIFATRRRKVWRGRLADLALIVPNPMRAVRGLTQDGRESEHTKAATARRVYQVIEFDFSELNKNGKETIWASLIRKWRANRTGVLDACASLILHLRERLPALACVCHSGGKSLHAWFRVFELTPQARWQFMRQAVRLGADHATWNRSQFVRIPDGLKKDGARQACFYLDPRKAVGS